METEQKCNTIKFENFIKALEDLKKENVMKSEHPKTFYSLALEIKNINDIIK